MYIMEIRRVRLHNKILRINRRIGIPEAPPVCLQTTRRLQQLFEFRRWVRIFGMRAKRLRFNFSQMGSSWRSVERIFLYNMA